ncbi:MAG TPA: Ig-like domain-containing protein, partial [Nitrososphaera sp.]|nr:Ig-like domain-containing protein [Nitrososphaera sp.]
ISEFDPQDGTLTYTPPAGFSGQDAFNFKAVDSRGVESNTATVTITINTVNQSPAEGSGVAEEDDSGDMDSDDDDDADAAD